MTNFSRIRYGAKSPFWSAIALCCYVVIGTSCDSALEKRPSDRGGIPKDISAQQMMTVAEWSELSAWDRARWAEKVARTFQHGRVLSTDEALAWAARPPEVTLDEVLASEQGALSAYRLFLSYLGETRESVLKERLYPDGEGGGAVVRVVDDALSTMFPSATAAAIAFRSDGDIEQLFRYQQPLFWSGPRDPAPVEAGIDVSSKPGIADEKTKAARTIKVDPVATRLARIDAVETQLGRLKAIFEAPDSSARSVEDICRTHAKTFEDAYRLINLNLPALELPWSYELTTAWFPFLVNCDGSEAPSELLPTHAEVSLGFERAARGLSTLRKILSNDFLPARSLKDVLVIDPATLGAAPELSRALASFGFYATNLNSSTNANRRRAASMLRTYFCDDLTPIGSVAAEASKAKEFFGSSSARQEDAVVPHVPAGSHASDPACASCHFKLDPLAGLFRHIGVSGMDFTGKSVQIFDDLAIYRGDRLRAYHDAWRAPVGSGRAWDTGIVRSTFNPSLNTYVDSLEDLFKFMRTSPYVRSCLVRKTAAAVVGPNVQLDGGWLASLDTHYVKEKEKTSSARAYKSLLKRLAMSRSFVTADPVPGVCYDTPEAENAKTRGRERLTLGADVPCSVRHILETNCTQCHGASSGGSGLDLSTWVEAPDGGGGMFLHRNAQGQLLPRVESFRRLMERISSSDIGLRMPPPPRDVDTPVRAEFFDWLQEQLQ